MPVQALVTSASIPVRAAQAMRVLVMLSFIGLLLGIAFGKKPLKQPLGRTGGRRKGVTETAEHRYLVVL